MIGYVTVGTNDIARATAFYDALLAEMGAKRFEGRIGLRANWNSGPAREGFANILGKQGDKHSAAAQKE